MTSHQWQPFLFCCPPPKRSGYGYWGDRTAIDAISPVIAPTYGGWLLPEKEAKWIIGEKDGRVFFGRHGWIGEVMGEDYPAATDNVGRRMAFFLVYSAPSGTPLPRIRDFEQMEATMKAGIDQFYAKLIEAYPYDDNITPAPTSFDFSGAQEELASDHAWDKMASEIEGGKKSTLLVINQQGEVQTQDLTPEPPKSDEPEQKKNGEPPDQESERKSSPSSSGQSNGYSATAHSPKFDSGKAAILVSLCAITIGVAAALLYKLRQKKDRQKEQTKGRDVGQRVLLPGKQEHGSHIRR